MNVPSVRAAFAIIVTACLLAVAVPATSQTAVQHHTQQRKELTRELRRSRSQHRRVVHRLRRNLERVNEQLRQQGRVDADRGSHFERWAIARWTERRRTLERLGRTNRTWKRRARKLVRRRDGHSSWLATYAVFQVCPVPGYSVIHDDFGEIVDIPGVPRHVHMGNDVQAAYGARIVAPFDGRAVGSWSEGGGYQVRVYGVRGYVYNAHLSAYGRLGYVRAGTTIGYVGSTGHSTAPHDHIEWHPGDGGAVDPFGYLALSCFG
jgi:murein DD-endopeptidase MepM/ murein hydrolase activator NlpD